MQGRKRGFRWHHEIRNAKQRTRSLIVRSVKTEANGKEYISFASVIEAETRERQKERAYVDE